MNHYQLGIRAIHQKDIKTAILEAKKNGFGVLEIHLSSPQFLPQNYNSSKLEDVKLFATKNNMVLQTHSEIGQSLLQADNILRTAEKLRLERAVKFSKSIGAVSLTLHPGNVPGYFENPGKRIANDSLYTKYYNELFEDSLKHVISIASKDLFICIENTDNFTLGYMKILERYLKNKKVFLTCDIMKAFSYKPVQKLREDQWKFFKRNITYVKNIHLSGPGHGSLEGCEKDFVKFFKLFQDKNIPMIIETLALKEAPNTRKIIQNLGF